MEQVQVVGAATTDCAVRVEWLFFGSGVKQRPIKMPKNSSNTAVERRGKIFRIWFIGLGALRVERFREEYR